MDHYQFIFEVIDIDKRNMLIALLADIGFEGFEEEENELKAFILMINFNQDNFDNIVNNLILKYSKSVIQEINWNAKWEAGFEPVLVNHPVSAMPMAYVRANFHPPVSGISYDLVITPKMSFGTGHHATTYLMMQQMSLIDFKGMSVIDFGTGTAILAIFAEKLGAANVTGIDNDEWSISNAKENIEANACNKINLIKADGIGLELKADVILANINLNIIISSLDAIRSASDSYTNILFSGIMLKDKEQLIDVLVTYNFKVTGCYEKDNWLILLANIK